MTSLTSYVLVFAFQFEFGVFVMIELNFAPLFFGMTCIASLAIIAVVRIVRFMAFKTRGLGLVLKHVAFVAILAHYYFMRPEQFEIGILIMIKLNSRPLLIMVTLVAFNSPVTFVNVFEIVAKITVLGCIEVPFVYMTILTPHLLMGVAQRKISFVMVKVSG